MTGYTARVTPQTTLADWLLIAAHAFFYDLDIDKPLPTGPDLKYEQERLREAEERLAKARAMTLKQAQVAQAESRVRSVQEHQKIKADYAAQVAYFKPLLQQVRRWDAPPELRNLKRFAADQLAEELKRLKWDWELNKSQITAAGWLRNERLWAEEALERAQQRLRAAEKSQKRTQEWVAKIHAECAKLHRRS